jgi:hypothetical protein
MYKMAVDKDEYFGYVFPATVAMLAGLYFLPSAINTVHVLNKIDFEKLYKRGISLVVIGFVAGFMPFLGFAGYLLINLKYIGLFYVYFSGHPKRYYWVVIIFVSLFLSSIAEGMFHDLLIWGVFFLPVYFITRNSSFMYRSILISLGFLLVLVIQMSKSDIRSESWSSNLTSSQKYAFGVQTIYDKLTHPSAYFSDDNIASNVTRINQGWIISNVMDHVPAREPFANGETVKSSIIASLFPRFILPDKEIAGGRNNMQKYAGITLNQNTSMDISQVGEAYANFGTVGGILFMFVLGLFFAFAIRFIENKSLNYPELLIWLPLLFIQVIKAETSLITILNHFVKASLITWFFFSPWGQSFLSGRFFRRNN